MLCPLCFAPVAQSSQSPACPGLKPSSSSSPETSIFLTPTAQPPQLPSSTAGAQRCRAMPRGSVGVLMGTAPPGHGHPMDRHHRGTKGQDAARAAPQLAAQTSPAQPSGCPESLQHPSSPWRASQTRPAGFRGAGGGLGHQGSRAKAFPRAVEGRMLCQEQHTSVRSPPLPSCKKQGKNPGRFHLEVQPARSILKGCKKRTVGACACVGTSGQARASLLGAHRCPVGLAGAVHGLQSAAGLARAPGCLM